jgi:hypothetical protein
MPYTADPITFNHGLIAGDAYQPAEARLLDAAGAAYDLTGVTGTCEIYDPASGVVLLSPTVTITAATGEFTWASTAAQTAGLAAGTRRMRLRLSWSGEPKTIIEGAVAVRRVW